MKNIVNFLFEVGMLKRTPRTGYQFLGSGKESVADHSFRTAIIGHILSLNEPGADPYKTILMCLVHDLHEARTGDHNFGKDIRSITHEFNKGESLEARISRDADQLDLIFELKAQKDLGNSYAEEWLYYALQRLVTRSAEELAQEILKTDSTDWWFEKKTDLWVNGPVTKKKLK